MALLGLTRGGQPNLTAQGHAADEERRVHFSGSLEHAETAGMHAFVIGIRNVGIIAAYFTYAKLFG